MIERRVVVVACICMLSMCGGAAIEAPRAAVASPAPRAATLDHVVVRFAAPSDAWHATARCLQGERLVSGGCDCGDQQLDASVPVAYGEDHTIGAGWRCSCGAQPSVPSRLESPLGAYALCSAASAGSH